MKKEEKLFIALAAGAGTAGLVYALWPKSKIPASAVVQPLHGEKYLGLWYEIARLPNALETNLKGLTEEYTPNADGSIKVTTKAYNVKKGKTIELVGTAKFAGDKTIGQLKVAYYVPVYFDYNVLDVDDEYQYALVSGSSLGYLWILSRTLELPAEIKQRFENKAASLGFDVAAVEWL